MTDEQSVITQASPLRVAHVDDSHMIVVLNGGRNKGIRQGDIFVVYHLSEQPVTDPISGEPLEPLLTVRGYGEVIQVQDRICTLRSSQKARVSATNAWRGISSALSALYPDRVYENEARTERPFESPEVGDLAIHKM